MEQYSRGEYIEIAGIPQSTTNDLFEEHVILISKIGVNIDELDIVFSQRLGSTDRTIVKLLNYWKMKIN